MTLSTTQTPVVTEQPKVVAPGTSPSFQTNEQKKADENKVLQTDTSTKS